MNEVFWPNLKFKMEDDIPAEALIRKYVPLEWDDDERMNFMFSAFPKNRNINPRHWDSKMTYWIEEVKKCCNFHQDICISCEKLRERFRRHDRFPQGFDLVLNELEMKQILVTPDKIMGLIDNGWIKWSYKMVTNSVSWLWKSTWKSNPSVDNKEYICYEILEKTAMAILAKHKQSVKNHKTDNVVPWNVIKNVYIINGRKLDDDELLYAMAILVSRGLADLATNDAQEKLVKFAKSDASTVTKIDENDWNIVCLKKAIAKLKLETAEMKAQISKLQNSAQICMKQKDRNQAKRLIIQKQKLNKNLNIKEDSLMSLTDQLNTIQNTESNKLVVDALGSGASLLNNSLREEGLLPEKLDEVIEKSIEANELAREVDNTISQGMVHLDDDIDLAELEDELALLLSEKDVGASNSTNLQYDDKEASNAMDFPYVPVHSPGRQKTNKLKLAI